MTKWIRFEQGGKTGFGTLEGEAIAVHSGDLFAGAKPSGQTLKLSEVRVLTPRRSSPMLSRGKGPQTGVNPKNETAS